MHIKILSFSSKGCISDDEYNHPIASLHSATSKQTTTTECQHNIITIDTCVDDDDNNNTSLENVSRNTSLLSPEFCRSPCRYQHFNNKIPRLPSPGPFRKPNEQQYISTKMRQSCSHEDLSHLSLQEKLTGDSGMGDLVEYPIGTSTQPLHYEVVPVYGQEGVVALMANRYEFDQAKIDEYLRHKRKNFLKSLFTKESHSTKETTLPPSGGNTNLKSSSTKSNSFLKRFRKSFQHAPIDEFYIEPIVRHHSSSSSHNRTNGDH